MSTVTSQSVPASAVDFYSRQALNRRRTWLLLAGFVLFFLLLGLGLDTVWGGFLSARGEPLPLATLGTLGLAAAMSLSAYFGGARLVMASLCAQPLNLNDPEHRQLYNIVTEMALAAGLPQPRVYLIPDPAPNALATGRDPRHAVLAVTQGLLNVLDREETQGVVAHEMAHIGNRDTLTMTLVAILLGGVVMLADWARRVLFLSSDRRRGNPLVFLVVVLLVAVTPLLSRLMAMAVSRQREYLADATAAQLTRNPLGVAHALEKIGAATSPLQAATRGTAHLFISNPLRRRVDERQGQLADLLSTHPPLAQRIAILRAMVHAA
ncbi:MAG TPA: M48 family metallopeptidase [Candidatus Margulisiibacteriota bacterium]|nr:M48 family metallopeptidase [Candidatus Margulisiibacteriota bacterium]